MNERIKELAKQSLPEFYLTNCPSALEKFAELIVQECAEQIKTQGIGASSEGHGDYEIGFNAGLYHALYTIKQHFGVAE